MLRTLTGEAMSTEQLQAEALSLPLPERISLAPALWQSIDAGLPEVEHRAAATAESVRRDEELSSGAVAGRPHTEVMQAARAAIGCA